MSELTSDDNVTAHDENLPAFDSASSTSSHSAYKSSTSGSSDELQPDPDQWHHIAQIEAIPFSHKNIVRIVSHAHVIVDRDIWFVCVRKFFNLKVNFCYRIPGPKNTWIARISSPANEVELIRIVGHHLPQEQKRYDRVHYITSESLGGKEAISLIIECKKATTRRIIRKATGPENIPSLQQRMGFQVIEV
ncbi:hypothetical protein HYE67_004065 [Fusarium culmorum]|uniref:Uncharacterized protein n=1 Tax=Fusarium culmorum TaxID=5516 RepID=A0A7S8D4G5_FUSCU|nr:hypothetical protein HYE67_004065 [Fusarium culmorum]